MVIEKKYNSHAQLHSVIEEALPNWMSVSDTSVVLGSCNYNAFYVGNTSKNVSILVYNDPSLPNGYYDNAAITIAAKNSEANLDISTGSVFGYATSSADTGNNSHDRKSGLVRIISTEHAFGVVLMDIDRVIKAGAAVAYKGALNDGRFWTFIGNDYSGSSSIAGPTTLIAQGMSDTVNKLRTTTAYYVNNYVLVPYCDWQHGLTEPVDDIYISYTRGSSGMPEILKDSEGNTYYRITSYYGSNYPTIYIKIKAE